tara:strand:- start:657 stop:911 length:255 start_codon:yes stop_codon:yes gene_type:complete
MTDTDKTHGATLRALRLQCSPPMRQGALAERLNITQSTISQIERGSRGLSVPMLKAAAAVLVCHLPMTEEQIIVSIVLCREVTS